MTPEEKWGFLTRGIERADPLILMQYISFFKDAILATDKELASLRAEVQKTMSGWQSDSVRLQSRIRQLEEAVEWACARFLETPRSLGFNFDVKELRRKAGM